MRSFIISLVISLAWLAFSAFLARGWFGDLSREANPIVAAFIIGGIALLPGFMNAFLVTSLLLDRQPELMNVETVDEPITILIAAYNEGCNIFETLAYIKRQTYRGLLRIIVIDNQSSDNTREEVERARRELNMSVELIVEPEKGKFNALNRGLGLVETEYFIGLDADTILHKDSIAYLVARALVAPDQVAAVAGSMLVRNSRDNILTRMQEWDYFLSIASVKRMQGLYQGTLVAQGAFSLYKTAAVREIGGWPEAIGEDIVVTWQLLVREQKVFFEPCAVAFTTAPTTLPVFIRQRSRWARGLFEGLAAVKPWEQPSWYQRVSTGFNLFIPLIDITYTIFWIPGLFIALMFHNYVIVGPMALLVLPFTFMSFGILYYYQSHVVFKKLDLKVRKNVSGFFLFMLVYQILSSPISLYGYIQEMLGLRRVWK